jgi:rhodanese-related sulfurtransferase
MAKANKQAPPSKPGRPGASKPLSLTTLVATILGAGAVAVVLFLLFQPAGGGGAGGGIRKVDSAGLLAAQKAGAQVIDVRSPGEFQGGHIPGAVNVPVEQIQSAAGGWSRTSSYVVYCASGARSAQAQSILQQMGFKNVADLTGGIAAWTGQVDKGNSTSNQTIQTDGKPVFIEFYTPT